MHDIIIIGAGPAGMTAALYALRAGKSVLVLEGESFGGQIAYSPNIENYPSVKSITGNEFANNLLEQITELGADIEFEKVLKIQDGEEKELMTESGEIFRCKSVIAATGVKHRKLALEKEDFFVGKGISYCAVCDGAFFKDLDVAVVGGGDTALQDALYLSNTCKKVYLIHRRDSFRAENKLVEKIKSIENIEFILNSNISKLIGKDKINFIEIANNLTLDKKEIKIDGLFIAIGQVPQNDNFSNIENLDDNGYFKTNESLESKIKGVFIAGDCRRKAVRQLTTAVSDGAIAAIAACQYIDNN